MVDCVEVGFVPDNKPIRVPNAVLKINCCVVAVLDGRGQLAPLGWEYPKLIAWLLVEMAYKFKLIA